MAPKLKEVTSNPNFDDPEDDNSNDEDENVISMINFYSYLVDKIHNVMTMFNKKRGAKKVS